LIEFSLLGSHVLGHLQPMEQVIHQSPPSSKRAPSRAIPTVKTAPYQQKKPASPKVSLRTGGPKLNSPIPLQVLGKEL